jgi:hypothetical protein
MLLPACSSSLGSLHLFTLTWQMRSGQSFACVCTATLPSQNGSHVQWPIHHERKAAGSYQHGWCKIMAGMSFWSFIATGVTLIDWLMTLAPSMFRTVPTALANGPQLVTPHLTDVAIHVVLCRPPVMSLYGGKCCGVTSNTMTLKWFNRQPRPWQRVILILRRTQTQRASCSVLC